MMIVSVVVQRNIKNISTFDYLVPDEYKDIINIGYRVLVPFGQIKLLGIVVGFTTVSKFTLKEIDEVLDLSPSLTKNQVLLAKEMSKKYFTNLSSNIFAMLPNALNSKIEKRYYLTNKQTTDNDLLTLFNDKEYLIHKKLLSNEKLIINKNIELKNVDFIEQLITKESILKSKHYTYIKDIKTTSKLRLEILEYIKNNEMCSKDDIDKLFDKATFQLKELEKAGAISVTFKERYRILDDYAKLDYQDVELTENQIYIYNSIDLNSSDSYLLRGVTSSGKTEIYLKLIEKVVNNNKNALLLIPEIILTAQVIKKFKSKFKDKVAIIHSGLNPNKKFDEYRKIIRDEVNIVIGARSSILSPIKNLGIIIVDEEHSDSYIQTNNPFYQTDYLANILSDINNCPLLLASATPKVSSLYKAKEGIYKYLSLDSRYNNMPHPTIKLVDMKKELEEGNKQILSRELTKKIIFNKKMNKKTMLMFNRRGYSSFIMCRSCSHIIKCDQCDVSLTYHLNSNTLKCNYCNKVYSIPKKCPNCNSPKIKEVGSGVDKLAQYVSNIIPNAKIYQLDSDKIKKHTDYEDILSNFINDGDILIGTQMIAKGLDIKDLTLVGVISADMILGFNDYRAGELTYQLLSQISGRAGRHNYNSEVIIQSYDTDHYSIKHAVNNNYLAFYNDELSFRLLSNYSPYYEMLQLKFMSSDKTKALLSATKCKEELKDSYNNVIITGPTNNYISKIKNKYHSIILLRYNDINNLDMFIETLNNLLDNNVSLDIQYI